MIQEYIEAFNQVYPQHKVEIKPARQPGDREQHYKVYINDDGGNIRFTERDLIEATNNLIKGRHH